MASEKLDVAEIQAAIAERNAGWQPGTTTMTELPERERHRRLGYVPGPGEPSLQEREQIAQASLRAVRAQEAGYPASYNLTNVAGQNFITSVKDQGGCGSCVAFGTLATVEGTMRVLRNDASLQ